MSFTNQATPANSAAVPVTIQSLVFAPAKDTRARMPRSEVPGRTAAPIRPGFVRRAQATATGAAWYPENERIDGPTHRGSSATGARATRRRVDLRSDMAQRRAVAGRRKRHLRVAGLRGTPAAAWDG